MKISYDRKVDAIYIHLREGRYEETRKITDSALVDLDKKGRILGVEILSASRQITDFSPQSVTFNWADLTKVARQSSLPRARVGAPV